MYKMNGVKNVSEGMTALSFMITLSCIYMAIFMILAPYLVLLPDVIFIMVMPATVFITSLGVMNIAFYTFRRLYSELSGKAASKKNVNVQTPASVPSSQNSQGATEENVGGSPEKKRKKATSGSSTLPPASPGGAQRRIYKRVIAVGVIPFRTFPRHQHSLHSSSSPHSNVPFLLSCLIVQCLPWILHPSSMSPFWTTRIS
jgi:hypothetical protein